MKNIKRYISIVGFICSSIVSSAQYPGQYEGKEKVQEQVPVKAYSFDLQDVTLLKSPFTENRDRDAQWLLALESKRLLHSFRVNAGVETNAKPLGGWEALDCELRGHSMGHILSGLALMYASTNDEAFRRKGDSLVTALAEVQTVLNQDGYLSAFPQYFVDRCIAGKPVWAPWYTIHKIMAGMIDMYLYTGNQQALDVVNKMSSWAYKKLSPLSKERLAIMERNEFGGMSESAYNLYAITGNKEDKALSEIFYDQNVLEPLAKKEDKLNKLHANTQIPKIIGEARGYELTGTEKQKDIANFFWQTVIDNHTYATGGNSDNEHFFEPGKLSQHLGVRTTESCNTYNMLKLTKHLFTWSANEQYADYYEQALYNHILATQDPQTSMVSYFMPFKPGSFKVYSTADSSFWCCVGTGFENHAKYGEGIYYHDDNGVFVNLFIPSELNWKDKKVKIRQETRYPEDATTTLTMEAPTDVALYIRYPSWAVNGATIAINGKNVKVNQKPGSYIVLNRKWKEGDKIGITFPMSLRLVGTPDNPNKAAIAYGPIVLAGAMGKEGIEAPAPYAKDQNDLNNYPVPDNLVHQLNTGGRTVTEWLKPANNAESLTFVTSSTANGKEISMIPYYKIHHQRYVIYWDLK
ncbi:glycoside hydrolase family 127 protein [Segetibacter koreensis]|uniref:glycoside hydrolase family 127 protein n=1 Tax=Segetibacter koreensis TaxID=398037 RepID=UPI00035EB73A|nr:glycoside hydrolase family 127 protein [Segetibacter koreensis]